MLVYRLRRWYNIKTTLGHDRSANFSAWSSKSFGMCKYYLIIHIQNNIMSCTYKMKGGLIKESGAIVLDSFLWCSFISGKLIPFSKSWDGQSIINKTSIAPIFSADRAQKRTKMVTGYDGATGQWLSRYSFLVMT